jgi:hypothetical protein
MQVSRKKHVLLSSKDALIVAIFPGEEIDSWSVGCKMFTTLLPTSGAKP